MTQQRLAQLRGNLENLRDGNQGIQSLASRWIAVIDSGKMTAAHNEIFDALADALGIAPDGAEGEQCK